MSALPAAPPPSTPLRARTACVGRVLRTWVDATAIEPRLDDPDVDRVDAARILPFVLLHVGCLGVLWTGWSWTAVVLAVALYGLRMFAITAFYHRYFAHRAFATSRVVQFAFAFLGNSAGQRGPLWWAAHHRKHHRHADTARDAHSPHEHGFLWSHVLWFTTRRNFRTDLEQVRDFARFPELRWLDRFDVCAPLALLAALFVGGEVLARFAPGLGTDGAQLVVWGFFVSTTLLFHGTSTINSLGHVFGSRRYDTPDTSRNNFFLALLTLGEGWHNNHHFYPVAARQGFFWWELDLTWYALRALAAVGLVWDLRPLPAHVRDGHRVPPRKDADA